MFYSIDSSTYRIYFCILTLELFPSYVEILSLVANSPEVQVKSEIVLELRQLVLQLNVANENKALSFIGFSPCFSLRKIVTDPVASVVEIRKFEDKLLKSVKTICEQNWNVFQHNIGDLKMFDKCFLSSFLSVKFLKIKDRKVGWMKLKL